LKQIKVSEQGGCPPNPIYDRLSFYIKPRILAEGARNELCTRLIDYRFVFSVKGMIQFGAKNTLLAFAPGEMSILYTPEMWRMSRGFVFDPCVLSM
jgi:hypothetical protein